MIIELRWFHSGYKPKQLQYRIGRQYGDWSDWKDVPDYFPVEAEIRRDWGGEPILDAQAKKR